LIKVAYQYDVDIAEKIVVGVGKNLMETNVDISQEL